MTDDLEALESLARAAMPVDPEDRWALAQVRELQRMQDYLHPQIVLNLIERLRKAERERSLDTDYLMAWTRIGVVEAERDEALEALEEAEAERDEWRAATSSTRKWALAEIEKADARTEAAEQERDEARAALAQIKALHIREIERNFLVEVEGGRATVQEDVDYCAECGDLTGVCRTVQIIDALAGGDDRGSANHSSRA